MSKNLMSSWAYRHAPQDGTMPTQHPNWLTDEPCLFHHLFIKLRLLAWHWYNFTQSFCKVPKDNWEWTIYDVWSFDRVWSKARSINAQLRVKNVGMRLSLCHAWLVSLFLCDAVRLWSYNQNVEQVYLLLLHFYLIGYLLWTSKQFYKIATVN